jgi:alpha-mannosidase
VVALMDEREDFVFACSSAQQYAWVAERHPELFERIRAKVAGGQFVPVGGMWVESDTNMPGGEALARQMVEGKRYFLEEFGHETQDVWLPDSFGYTGALPQIVRAAGSRWFLSQKLSWNDTNRMPHHTFHWEGIDGSRVLAHFPPVDTYNSDLSPRELAHAEREFRDKDVATESLVPFGWGDGGGGQTDEMLETLARVEDLQGVPRTTMPHPEAFFRLLEEETDDRPEIIGELYGWSTTGHDMRITPAALAPPAGPARGRRRAPHRLRSARTRTAGRTPRSRPRGCASTRRCCTAAATQTPDRSSPATRRAC